ncbi:MAG: DUF4159 domain-containing protein [Phycisphaerales bacterium]
MTMLMTNIRDFAISLTLAAGVVLGVAAIASTDTRDTTRRGEVNCANLVYANGKTSQCFASEFMAEVERETNIATSRGFQEVALDSPDLFEHPFAVMTGEGAFVLTETQRSYLRDYLSGGGFLVASAGCSSRPWADSFRREMLQVLPDAEMITLDMAHPIFHTVYDINTLTKKSGSDRTSLEGIEIDGRIVCVFSSDGLNDTANAGGSCCCCGGNEIKNARQVNVNLLAYALTH